MLRGCSIISSITSLEDLFIECLSLSRKGREVESRVSDSSNEEQLQTVQSYHSEAGKGVGLLPVDRCLLSHITHTLSHISPLPTLTEQAQALARSASHLLHYCMHCVILYMYSQCVTRAHNVLHVLTMCYTHSQCVTRAHNVLHVLTAMCATLWGGQWRIQGTCPTNYLSPRHRKGRSLMWLPLEILPWEPTATVHSSTR